MKKKKETEKKGEERKKGSGRYTKYKGDYIHQGNIRTYTQAASTKKILI
jgi:hypothetical protein